MNICDKSPGQTGVRFDLVSGSRCSPGDGLLHDSHHVQHLPTYLPRLRWWWAVHSVHICLRSKAASVCRKIPWSPVRPLMIMSFVSNSRGSACPCASVKKMTYEQLVRSSRLRRTALVSDRAGGVCVAIWMPAIAIALRVDRSELQAFASCHGHFARLHDSCRSRLLGTDEVEVV